MFSTGNLHLALTMTSEKVPEGTQILSLNGHSFCTLQKVNLVAGKRNKFSLNSWTSTYAPRSKAKLRNLLSIVQRNRGYLTSHFTSDSQFTREKLSTD